MNRFDESSILNSILKQASEEYSDNSAAKFIIQKNPKNRNDFASYFSEYLKKIKFRFEDFDSYSSSFNNVQSIVSKKIPETRYTIISTEEFKKEHDKDPKIGMKIEYDVSSPGVGKIKYKVVKINGNKVYIDIDSSGVRELSINDVK